MVTRIAPIFAVAYWVNSHSAQFGAQIPTRSPLPIPAPSSPCASASISSCSCAYVHRRWLAQSISASRLGQRVAARSKLSPIVSPSNPTLDTPDTYDARGLMDACAPFCPPVHGLMDALSTFLPRHAALLIMRQGGPGVRRGLCRLSRSRSDPPCNGAPCHPPCSSCVKGVVAGTYPREEAKARGKGVRRVAGRWRSRRL